MKASRQVLTLVVLAISLAACSSGTQGAVDSGTGAQTGPDADILDFAAPGLDRPEIQGRDYSGKDVALWFWAPW